MSLLDNFPHTATSRRRTRANDTLGGGRDAYTTRYTGKLCWQQSASQREITEFEKRGISVTHKVYFLEDTGDDERDVLDITSPTAPTLITLEVRSKASPDASAGLGVVWAVFAERRTTGSTA